MATKPASPALQGGNSLSTGLVVGLMLGEGSGSTSTDLSGNSATGTLTSGATWTTDAAGNAVACTGGQYLSVPWPAVASGDDYAFLCTLLPTSWPGGFTLSWDDTGRQWSLFFDTSGGLSFNGTMTAFISVPGNLTAGTLWRSVITRVSAVCYWYVNGSLLQTISSGLATTASATSTTLHFGDTTGAGSSFNGLYDEVCFWNARGLSAGDVAALETDPYQMFRPGAPPPALPPQSRFVRQAVNRAATY